MSNKIARRNGTDVLSEKVNVSITEISLRILIESSNMGISGCNTFLVIDLFLAAKISFLP